METLLSLGLSLHIGFYGDYNFIHPNIRLTDDNRFIGAYYNSEDNISLYAGQSFNINEDTSIELGIVTGYDDTVYPYGRIKYKQFFITPGIENDNVGLVIGIEIKWKN